MGQTECGWGWGCGVQRQAPNELQKVNVNIISHTYFVTTTTETKSVHSPIDHFEGLVWNTHVCRSVAMLLLGGKTWRLLPAFRAEYCL